VLDSKNKQFVYLITSYRHIMSVIAFEFNSVTRQKPTEWKYRCCLLQLLDYQLKMIDNFVIPCVVCLATGPQSPPEGVLHRVQSSASSVKFQCLILSLRSFTMMHEKKRDRTYVAT